MTRRNPMEENQGTTVQPTQENQSDSVTLSRAEVDEMRAQIRALHKATVIENTAAQCNVCGDLLDEGQEKCPKHPFDRTNHIRPATDKEKAEAGHGPNQDMFTLVRQT